MLYTWLVSSPFSFLACFRAGEGIAVVEGRLRFVCLWLVVH